VSFEVIVVDNNSTDESKKTVKEGFPQVLLLENSRNIGFSAANNQAIKTSCGKYILLLNPDTIVLPCSLDILFEFMDKHHEVAVAGPKLLNPDGTCQPSCRSFPSLFNFFTESSFLYKLFPTSKIFGKFSLNRFNYDKVQQVDMVKGACMIIRREALDQVGLMDENFFMYAEETDLCYRIKKQDWSVYFFPKAQIIHYGRQSTKAQSSKMFIELHKSYRIFFKKHFGTISLVYLWVILFAGILLRVILWTLMTLLYRKHNKSRHKEKLRLYWETLKWYCSIS